MQGKRYKDTIAMKGSNLRALMESNSPEAKKAAEVQYNQTTANFKALYPAEDVVWFMEQQRLMFENQKNYRERLANVEAAVVQSVP